jgi:chemotaxis family two-component system response regulator PixH
MSKYSGKKTIAIVDDSESQLKLVSLYLKDSYNTMAFSNPDDFISYLKSGVNGADNFWKPDLVILDRMMPSFTGDNISKLLKGFKEFSTIPIIICSGLASYEDILSVDELGADDYLTKPVLKDDLLVSISSLV